MAELTREQVEQIVQEAREKGKRPNLIRADLSGADLNKVDLSGANLRRTNLSSVDLRGTDLSGANLSQANLSGANLFGVDLTKADLSEAYLSGVNLQFAKLIGTNLSQANLFSVDLTKADLRGTDLFRADLSQANLFTADLREADLREADLRGADLSGADLRGADLRGADLRGANLRGAKLGWAYLSGANLSETNLSGTNLSETDLSGAKLGGANLRGADLSGANLGGANLSGTNLRGANLSEADLRGANLNETNLSGANLSEADLRGANLNETNLNGTNLRGAGLSKARLWHTVFTDIDLSEVKGLDKVKHCGTSPISISTLTKSKGNIPIKFLRGCGLSDVQIEMAKLHKPGLTAGQVTDTLYKINNLYAVNTIRYHSCFIRYSHKDEKFTRQLYDSLRDTGVCCWYAPEDMKIDDEIRSHIGQSIRIHDKLLLILSEHSINSVWVKDEVEYAFELEEERGELVLFPIWLDATIMNNNVGWAGKIKRGRHIGDFCAWKDHDTYQKSFERLLRDLKVGDS